MLGGNFAVVIYSDSDILSFTREGYQKFVIVEPSYAFSKCEIGFKVAIYIKFKQIGHLKRILTEVVMFEVFKVMVMELHKITRSDGPCKFQSTRT